MSFERQVDENNAAVEDGEEDVEEEYSSGGNSFIETLALIPSWAVSTVAHLCLLVTLALINFDTTQKPSVTEIVSNPVEEAEEPEEELEEPEEINLDPEAEISPEVEASTDYSVSETEVNISSADDMSAAAVSVNLVDISNTVAPRNALGNVVGAYSGDAFSGRGSGKARAVAMGGGTTESERAVALGLQWIANHQYPNGGWSFDHQKSPGCHGLCKNAGESAVAVNGATGMALLPFLGAGVTHKEGKYKTAVYKGITFLVKSGKVDAKNRTVSYVENGGSIYSHGIVAICLSEAYAMTKDKSILPHAQGSLNYICWHQDPVGGGWRYKPQQKGDTSAVGWQLMALKSGYMAGLSVPPKTINKATKFLDSVQEDSGAKYGYTDPGHGGATTAVGLLARMYLGWKHDNPALERGAEWLSKIGPSKNDSYYNYYATQVMRQYDGPLWKKWNAVMRDQMVNSQDQTGHQKGSWYHSGHWSKTGGRLYDTALSTMVLEVYYRHMPIYKAAASKEGFPLE